MRSRWGSVVHASGLAPSLWERGWLPRACAASALGLSLAEFDADVRDRRIKWIAVGYGARLYDVGGRRV